MQIEATKPAVSCDGLALPCLANLSFTDHIRSLAKRTYTHVPTAFHLHADLWLTEPFFFSMRSHGPSALLAFSLAP